MSVPAIKKIMNYLWGENEESEAQYYSEEEAQVDYGYDEEEETTGERTSNSSRNPSKFRGENPVTLVGNTVIADNDVPLAELPVEEVPLAELPEMVEDIPEVDVPLADVPKTSDVTAIYSAIGGTSALGIIATLFAELKRRK